MKPTALLVSATAINCDVQSAGNMDPNSSYPPNYMPIVVTNKGGSTVSFNVLQAWKGDTISWMSVEHQDSSGTWQCPKADEVGYGSTRSFTAKCSGGSATVKLWIHDGSFKGLSDITPSIPAYCSPSADSGKKVAYYYSVPCNAQCSPAGTTTKPVTVPTSMPSFKPTLKPTAASVSCVVQSAGNMDPRNYYPPKSMPIVVTNKGGTTVSFDVVQTWTSSLCWMSVEYQASSTGSFTCPKAQGLSYLSKRSFTAKCVGGYATVKLWMHDETFTSVSDITASVPAYCSPSTDYGHKVAYFYTVPCNSQCSPAGPTTKPLTSPTLKPTTKPSPKPTLKPTALPSGKPIAKPTAKPSYKPTTKHATVNCVVQSAGNMDPNSSYPPNYMPIVVTNKGGSTVSFNVLQAWKGDTISWMSVEYQDSSGTWQCPKADEVGYGSTRSFTAKCSGGSATVKLWIHDGSFKGLSDITPSIPAYCSPSADSGKKVAYYFSVPCSSTC
jgi:hypothetical protein